MRKKGQITIFLIIGIIILISSVFFFILKKEIVLAPLENEEINQIPFTKDAFNEYIESCIGEKAYPAIKLMSEFGGTLNLDYYKQYQGQYYRYFLDYGSCDTNRISKANMQSELNNYIKSNLIKCIDFSNFKKQKYKISLF